MPLTKNGKSVEPQCINSGYICSIFFFPTTRQDSENALYRRLQIFLHPDALTYELYESVCVRLRCGHIMIFPKLLCWIFWPTIVHNKCPRCQFLLFEQRVGPPNNPRIFNEDNEDVRVLVLDETNQLGDQKFMGAWMYRLVKTEASRWLATYYGAYLHSTTTAVFTELPPRNRLLRMQRIRD